jgi:N6-adenosine-specific RNA methylase IME4
MFAGISVRNLRPHDAHARVLVEKYAGLVWVKPSIGMGNYVRQQHEHLLMARRGEFPLPESALRPGSIIEAPRREHSRKPDQVYEMIERMYPELPRIELFARQARPGWDAWGNEIGAADAVTAE